MRASRRIGAELRDEGVSFVVWAPRRRRVAVVVEGVATPLEAEADGWFAGFVSGARAGNRYRFRLDDEGEFPDPASRHQPEGPHGPSQIVDSRFDWTDGAWRGPDPERQVFYELHIGCYTPEGTYRALIGELDALVDLGVTCLEIMPLAEFPGRFGWGYDGVNLFAPSHLYGTPDDLRALIDAAHARGLSAILDVVYNHLGPDGNYLDCYSHDYVTRRYENEWGEALNFDGEHSGPVRALFVENARRWIEEYHFDGLRLDATQSMHDASPRHVLAEISTAVREASGGRRTLLVAENEPQDPQLLRPIDRGGCGLDFLWNDDFHHSAIVAVSGRREAYYTDYLGTAAELLATARHGFLFQGQHYRWQNKRRGAPARDLAGFRRVNYVQNHDQVANSARGLRLDRETSAAELRAITAFLLLSPGTPLLFMGQEFAASSPFLYFADHRGELSRAVRQGRRQFLEQFESIATPEVSTDDPGAEATFFRSKLDLRERERHRWAWSLHRDLLRLRRDDPVLSDRQASFDGAVLGERALCLRWSASEGERLLLLNLDRQHAPQALGEPLLAPRGGVAWKVLWSSEGWAYGGHGVPPVEHADGRFELPARAAVLLSEGAR